MKIEEVHHLIRNRRSVYPPQYTGAPIPDHILKELLETANWAPTHKLTEPWRFKVIRGDALKRFGVFMAEKYREITPLPEFSVAKYEKLKMNPLKAGAIFAVCLQRDEKERIPEWEEVASVAMAVENMWIACSAYGIGAYWSSPGLMQYFHEFQPLRAGEKCLGFFYMGYVEPVPVNPSRKPVEEKVVWIDK